MPLLLLQNIETWNPATVELEPAPIHPQWVIAGNPVARAKLLTVGSDEMSSTAAWDCTAGMFYWYFSGDEIVHILEGRVHVQNRETSRWLAPGEMALFRANTWAVWYVPHYVRKLAVFQDPLPRAAKWALRVKRKWDHVLGKAKGKPLPPKDLRFQSPMGGYQSSVGISQSDNKSGAS